MLARGAPTTDVAVAAAVGTALFLLSCLVPQTGLTAPFDAPPLQWLGEALARGGRPYSEVFVEYPPLAVPLLAAPDLVGFISYGNAFKLLQGVAAVLAVWGTAAFAGSVGFSRRRCIAAAAFVGLAPAALGGLALNRFDLWPSALVVIALTLVVADRATLGATVLALACLVKATPVLLVPAVVVFIYRRRGTGALLRPALAFTATIAVVVVPVLVVAQNGLTNSVLYHRNRPLHLESVFGGGLAAIRALRDRGSEVEFTYGSVNLVGAAADALATASSAAVLAAVTVIAWLLYRGRATPERLVLAAAATTAAAMLFGKVLSPQYTLWLVPLVPLAPLPLGAVAAALLLALLAVTRFVHSRVEQVWALDPVALAWLNSRHAVLAALTVLLTVGLARRAD